MTYFKRMNTLGEVQRFLPGFMILALIANAVICGGISMVDVRFQYRVIWIVPIFAMLIFGPELSKKWNALKSSNQSGQGNF